MAENVWYNNDDLANEIAINMSGRGDYSHLSIENNILHSELLINYLNEVYKSKFGFREEYLSDETNVRPIAFEKTLENISNFKAKLKINEHAELQVGTEHKGKIVNIQSYGIFCEIIGTEKSGLIHMSELEEDLMKSIALGIL